MCLISFVVGVTTATGVGANTYMCLFIAVEKIFTIDLIFTINLILNYPSTTLNYFFDIYIR